MMKRLLYSLIVLSVIALSVFCGVVQGAEDETTSSTTATTTIAAAGTTAAATTAATAPATTAATELSSASPSIATSTTTTELSSSSSTTTTQAATTAAAVVEAASSSTTPSSTTTTTTTTTKTEPSSTTTTTTTSAPSTPTTTTSTLAPTTTTTTTSSTLAPTTTAAPSITAKPAAAVTPKDARKGRMSYYISDDIPTCQQKDLNLNDCLKQAFATMIPRLKHGNKELNVPSIDPFVLNRTTFQFANGPVNGRLTMRKAQILGLGDTKINEVDFKIINDNSTKYQMTSVVPLASIAGSYKADITFNAIRLRPRGTFNVTMANIKMNQVAEGNLYDKDDHRFVRLTKHDIQPKVESMKIKATGLLPDPILNDIVVNFINQYWREIYRVMLTETRQYWGPRLLAIMNESLASVPFDLLIKNN